ncbi:MAG: hypothetical protein LBU65_01915 [Planctomycetaceae bacterium]|jgi:hypothetical protein|nr:hypothetical protein [Planctomycetaceae bacterium]
MPSNLKDEYVSSKPATESAQEEKSKQSGKSAELTDGMKNLGKGALQAGKGMLQVSSVVASLTYAALCDLHKQMRKDTAETIDLEKEVLHFLTDHCAEQFSLPKESVEKYLKEIVQGNGTLKDTPLDNILRIELVITKASKENETTLTYKVVLLLAKDGQPVRQTITLPLNGQWDYAPDELRKKFIEQDKDEFRFLIYSV